MMSGFSQFSHNGLFADDMILHSSNLCTHLNVVWYFDSQSYTYFNVNANKGASYCLTSGFQVGVQG